MTVAVNLGGISIPPTDVASISIQRGRQDELDRHATGTATINLNVRSDRVNPVAHEIVGGTATIALSNPLGGSGQLFEGIVDDPQYDAHNSRQVTRGAIQCVDGLDKLARVEIAPDAFGTVNPRFGYEVPAGYAGQVFYEDAGQVQFRIDKLLDEALWPAGKRAIFSGNVGLMEMLYSPRTPILQIIHDCCDAEFPGIGQFFIDRTGVARFKGRLARFNPSDPQYDVTTYQVGMDDPTKAQVRDMSYSRPRSRIINAALFMPRLTPEHRRAGQVVLDAGSITQYGLHDESAEELQTEVGYLGVPNRTGLQETRLFGVYYVDNYSEPRTRVDSLVFRAMKASDPRAAATWALLCNIELTDLVVLELSGPGYAFNEGFFVERINYEITPAREAANVTLTLGLSPQAYYSNNPF